MNKAQRTQQCSTPMKTPAHLAKLVDEDPQQQRRRRFCYAGWHAEDSKSIAIVFRAKDRKWHLPARDRQNAAAGTIQYGEQNRCGGGFKWPTTAASMGCSATDGRADIIGSKRFMKLASRSRTPT
jgi:hypothetical protein